MQTSIVAGVAGAPLNQCLSAEDCRATTSDILGPFYQPNAPFRSQVALPGEPGEKLWIRGSVSDCKGPVKDAIVEIWQANAAGCYSVNEDCGVVPGSPDQFRLRGRIKTDEKGRYAFSTIKPAAYQVGAGRFRPSHIHYKITAPAAGGGYGAELITQLYFQGDPYNATDSSSSKPEAKSRTITLEKDSSGALQGHLDIVLPSAQKSARLEGDDLLVRRGSNKILFITPESYAGRGRVAVYKMDGSVLREWETVEGPVEWKLGPVARGIYLARLFHGDEIEQTVHLRV